MQQLVAREDELNLEIQRMENQTKEDEPALLIQQEIEEEVTTTTFFASDVEGAEQKVISQSAQDENKPNQSKITSTNQGAVQGKVPDTLLANSKTCILQSPSLNSDMKFYVRSLEGHNDAICCVHCEGSVLVSGRYVSLCAANAIDDKYCMAFHCHACFLVQFPFLTL